MNRSGSGWGVRINNNYDKVEKLSQIARFSREDEVARNSAVVTLKFTVYYGPRSNQMGNCTCFTGTLYVAVICILMPADILLLAGGQFEIGSPRGVVIADLVYG